MASTHSWPTAQKGAAYAAAVCEQIKDEFHAAHAAAARPAVMAVFISRSEGDLHCQVTAYFSPQCVGLAQSRQAMPCATPARAGLELLVGPAECWSALFGERD